MIEAQVVRRATTAAFGHKRARSVGTRRTAITNRCRYIPIMRIVILFNITPFIQIYNISYDVLHGILKFSFEKANKIISNLIHKQDNVMVRSTQTTLPDIAGGHFIFNGHQLMMKGFCFEIVHNCYYSIAASANMAMVKFSLRLEAQGVAPRCNPPLICNKSFTLTEIWKTS
jgi:hypothetical protein